MSYFSIKTITITALTMAFYPFAVFAQIENQFCSSAGYTVATVNGVLTNEDGAIKNRDDLQFILRRKFGETFNNEPLTVDYLLNPSHAAGLGDALKVVLQKYFSEERVRDTDLLSMLTDASAKVKTQKLLLVAHSQGNFYANSFYDSVADKAGGLPAQAMGVYAVATPSDHVAGGGLYLTSGSDIVISGLASWAPFKKIMPPNDMIQEVASDWYLLNPFATHYFSDVYLKYRANTVVSDIQMTLDKLQVDPERREDAPCIDPPKLTIMDKAAAITLSFTDGAVGGIVKGIALDVKVVSKTIGIASAVGDFTGKQVFRAEVFAVKKTVTAVKATVNTAFAVGSKISGVTTALIQHLKDQKSDLAASQGASLLGAVTSEPIQSSVQGEALDTALDTIFGTDATDEGGMQPIQPTQSMALDDVVQGEVLDNSVTGASSESFVVAPLVVSVPSSSSGGGGGGGSPTPVSVTPVSDEQVQDSPSEETPAQDTGQATTTVDTTAPVIIINGENPATVFVGDPYTDAGATALDETDGARTVSSLLSVDIFTAGSYAVTYTATDLVGNIATTIRIVNVVHDETMLASSDLNGNAIPDSGEDEVVVSVAASLSAGEYSFDTLKITASSTLTLMGTTTSARTFKGVKIVARNIIVDAGASISADRQGYGQSISGPGAAIYPGGASYGGAGHNNTATSVYGSAVAPIELGSSGPSVCCSVDKNGGGAIRLVVAGTLTNNGTISADGSSPSTSGGSIYVTTNNLSGEGSFHANGGSGSTYYYTGAGGGGRVAIYYQNSSYGGPAEALGGLHYDGWSSSSRVGAGTTGFFDMTNNDFYVRAPWRFQADDGPFNLNRIIIENGATVSIEDGAQVTANELALSGASSLSAGSGSTIAIPAISVDGQSSLTFSGNETLTVGTLSVMGTSTVSVAQGVPLVLSARDITISAGSSINVDGKGYAPTTGPGAPIEYYDGASYGGAGYNNSATSTYGSAFYPTDMGSGGNGHGSYAYGGGAVKLVASGVLTINGTISANGGQTSSGGSIYLVADTITGSGTLSAGGGGMYWAGQYIGPGGGGRIAIDSPNSSFLGSMSAPGMCYSSSGYTMGCSENGSVVYGASIGSFDFAALSPAVSGTIDERAHTISLAVPHGTDVTALAPTITVSRGATVAPASGEAQDFTNSILYIATSATSSTSTYAVTVTVSPEPDTTPPIITISAYDGITSTSTPVTVTATTSEGILNAESHTFTENGSFDFIATDDTGNTATSTVTIANIDTIPPSITNYLLNGISDAITIDLVTTPVTLAITASENVDWVSVRIEDESESDNYKIFYSGTGCEDGTDTCAKTWDGTMSHGTLVDGTYRIKVKIEDMVGNLYQEYLSPYVITVASPSVPAE